MIDAVMCRGMYWKIPINHSFFHVARQLEKIADQMYQSYFLNNLDASNMFRDIYLQFLDECGWTETAYDTEFLRHIDLGW